ncbi:DUF2066 domain-containing protein [Aestuariivirga litoralis]|uniref:DUF2066 domain-containing protein n=1 Tax=Aestuariivirga litoralis TaxID=2650924 RepID=UPI0018C6E744|nr:DUF2066 domain-containing protein [Aestuariivirga litoralis]
MAFLFCSAIAHADDDILYRAGVIVTGVRDETRIPAIPTGFELAAGKLTGNPDIAQKPGFAPLAAKSSGMVWSFTYHDRLFGKPIHDEQGTRDRPFDLTFQFDRKMMDAAIATLGERPWLTPRPRLAVVLEVTDMARTYLLAADSGHGVDQRASFADASARFAMPITFATEADLSAAGITPSRLNAVSHDVWTELLAKLGADAIVTGHLDWDAKALGWHAAWRLPLKPEAGSWEISGVNFDAAFRYAIGGAAKRLRPN